eukprot:gene26855-33012_t
MNSRAFNFPKYFPLVISAFAGAIAAIVLCNVAPRHKEVGRNAFVLAVDLVFTDSLSRDQFLKDARVVARHCRRYEPETLMYEVLQSEKDPLKLQFLERYANKDDSYLTKHKSSQPFKTFREKLQNLQESGKVAITGNGYNELGIGYM